jgi:hypothetical protein
MLKTIRSLLMRRQPLPASVKPPRQPTRLEVKAATWLSEWEQRMTPSQRKSVFVSLGMLGLLFFGYVLVHSVTREASGVRGLRTGNIHAPEVALPEDTVSAGQAWLRFRQLTDSIHH